MTTTPYPVTTAERRVANVNPTRKSLAFFNLDGANIAYVRDGKGAATVNSIPVYPRGNVSLNLLEDGETVKADWWAVGDGALTLVVFEGIE